MNILLPVIPAYAHRSEFVVMFDVFLRVTCRVPVLSFRVVFSLFLSLSLPLPQEIIVG